MIFKKIRLTINGYFEFFKTLGLHFLFLGQRTEIKYVNKLLLKKVIAFVKQTWNTLFYDV